MTEHKPVSCNFSVGDTRITGYYRNFGKYHAVSGDWVSSGKAICGADVRRPAYSVDGPPFPHNHSLCGHCAKIITKKLLKKQ